MAPIDLMAMAARFVVGATLLVAAWSKLRDMPAFAAGVHAYGVLRPSAESPVVGLLPASEAILGVALVLGLALPWSAIAAATLLAAFGLVLAIATHRGVDVPCHCFGASDHHRVGAGAVARSLVLTILALLGAMGGGPSSTLWPLAAGMTTSETLASLLSLMMAMTLAIILAEPVVLMMQGLVGARRRVPALKAIEARRMTRHQCGAAPTTEV